jgi:hypothetical protein
MKLYSPGCMDNNRTRGSGEPVSLTWHK